MDLVETIRGWQKDARSIDPIDGVDKTIEDVGRLKGRAFFPEGLGLQRPNRTSGDQDRPDILVVGHYFGKRSYRDRIEKKHGVSEESQPTWRNLSSLLGEALMDRCFMTNWFIGFGPGKQASSSKSTLVARAAHLQWQNARSADMRSNAGISSSIKFEC